jgi:hypothetical protein
MAVKMADLTAHRLHQLLKSGVARVAHGKIILPSQAVEPSPPVSESEHISEEDFLDSLGGPARPASTSADRWRRIAVYLLLGGTLLGALIVEVLT